MVLLKKIVCRFGLPSVIVLDNCILASWRKLRDDRQRNYLKYSSCIILPLTPPPNKLHIGVCSQSKGDLAIKHKGLLTKTQKARPSTEKSPQGPYRIVDEVVEGRFLVRAPKQEKGPMHLEYGKFACLL
ncbi:hypothetical protein CR513_42428, partial [Mucuna pruriens]